MSDSGASAKLDQKTAEQLARFFNVAFNGALLYGGDHPTTKKGVEPFTSLLIPVLEKTGTISIVLDRDSLFLEEYCLDKVFNCKRIMAQFHKTDIISVTFEYGVRLQDIQSFIKICGESNEGITFDTIIQEMNGADCRGIKLNYVRYGKITDDQAIVNKDMQSITSVNSIVTSEIESIGKTALKEIEKIASLSQLLEKPEKTASVLKMGIENPETTPMTLSALTELRKAMSSSTSTSMDLLLNAVFELKTDLASAIEAQKATGRILAKENPVTAQVDDLTVDVIVKLVKEEYGGGDLSIKRLSQILLRMLPDLNELKRVLPKLKKELLAQGMPLIDYCQMVNLLDTELESEMLSTSLSEAAEGIGVSVQEIVSAIKAQPSEAARLIYLAAEIRQGAHSDDTYLSNLLTDYIEKVTTDLALDRKELTGPQGSKMLRTMLLQLENQLIDKMKNYGVEGEMLHQVKQQLSNRFEGLVTEASDLWLSKVIPDEGDNVDTAVTKITSFFGKTFGADQNRDTLVNALQSKGYSQERINTFFKRLTEQVSDGQSLKLPPNVLSSRNMRFLLNRELKQQARYNIPLSTIMITIVQIKIEDQIRVPQEDEADLLLPQMFRTIKKLIREIDLLGTLGEPYSNAIFLILSMTDTKGAEILAHRIDSALAAKQFVIGKEKVKLQIATSMTHPIKDVTIDLKSYLKQVNNDHKNIIKSITMNQA